MIALAILHWDFWWWDDRTLLFGFMPIGLGYQALISLLAGLAWEDWEPVISDLQGQTLDPWIVGPVALEDGDVESGHAQTGTVVADERHVAIFGDWLPAALARSSI